MDRRRFQPSRRQLGRRKYFAICYQCHSINQLLTLAKIFYFDQMITEPARINETTSNTLELFFTSNPTLINMGETIPGISDHEAVFIESSLRCLKVKIPQRTVFQYQKADYKGMRKNSECPCMDSNMGYPWTTFKKKRTISLMERFPSKMLQGNKPKKPWVTKVSE